MSADLLRRAAAKLREHAGYRATPGPWTSDAGRVRSPLAKPGTPRVRDRDPALAIMRLTEDADYAAMMHPPVALALADWLDLTAGWINFAPTSDHAVRAVAVARAILREPATGGEAAREAPPKASSDLGAVLREPGDTP